MTRLAAPLTALLTTAAPVLAQDASGSITAIVDAEPRNWQVVRHEGADGTHWRQTDGAVRVQLAGREEPKAISQAPNLRLSFETTELGPDAEAGNLTVTLSRTAETEPFVATPTNSDITLTASVLEGDTFVVAGEFTAVLSPEPTDRVIIEGEEGAMVIDGTFQATVPRAAPSED